MPILSLTKCKLNIATVRGNVKEKISNVVIVTGGTETLVERITTRASAGKTPIRPMGKEER